MTGVPEKPSEGSEDHPTNEQELARNERTALEQRAAILAGVRRSAPTEPASDLNETELSRRLIYDLIHTLARCEIVIQQGAEALETYTEVLRRENRVTLARLNQRERELVLLAKMQARDEDRLVRRFGLIEWVVKAAANAGAVLFRDARVTAAVVSAIITLITTLLASWGIKGFDPSIFQVGP